MVYMVLFFPWLDFLQAKFCSSYLEEGLKFSCFLSHQSRLLCVAVWTLYRYVQLSCSVHTLSCLTDVCLQQSWQAGLASEYMLEILLCSVFWQEMVSSILLENLRMGNWDYCLNSWRTIESHSLYRELWKRLIRLLVVENTQLC